MALEALTRIDEQGAYANLVLPALLERSDLAGRDRRFVTELVYGTTRMRRACDFLVDRFLSREPPPRVRNALRLGAYQLAFADVAAHAAVSETVAVTPRQARGLVNAVLRRVAEDPAPGWPDDATRLSYPDWLVARLTTDLEAGYARAALEAMNRPAMATERPDHYIQDRASQLVAEAVQAQPGDRILDACAAPGGKATALATAGAWVAAADIRLSRLGLVRSNVERLWSTSARSAGRPGPAAVAAGGEAGVGATAPPGRMSASVWLVAADGTRPPWRPASFDRVLIDAPCSGLGTLRRRADLRWRVEEEAVERLARLQRRLVAASVPLLRPGGILVYSVCTLTRAETLDVDDWLVGEHPGLEPLDPPGEPWQPWGRGTLLLPQTADTDGMALFRYHLARR